MFSHVLNFVGFARDVLELWGLKLERAFSAPPSDVRHRPMDHTRTKTHLT